MDVAVHARPAVVERVRGGKLESPSSVLTTGMFVFSAKAISSSVAFEISTPLPAMITGASRARSGGGLADLDHAAFVVGLEAGQIDRPRGVEVDLVEQDVLRDVDVDAPAAVPRCRTPP